MTLEELQAEVEKLNKIIAEKDAVIQQQNVQIENMLQAILHARKERFGAKSEATLPGQFSLFTDEQQEALARALEEQKKEMAVPDKKPSVAKKSGVSRDKLAGLPVEVTVCELDPQEVCDLCGRRMVIKYGPHGRFLACPGFPECKNTKPYFEKIGVACPNCGGDIVLKKTRKGRKYFGCINNPECDFMVWQKPVEQKCPKCGSIMLQKGNKLMCSNEKCGYLQ